MAPSGMLTDKAPQVDPLSLLPVGVHTSVGTATIVSSVTTRLCSRLYTDTRSCSFFHAITRIGQSLRVIRLLDQLLYGPIIAFRWHNLSATVQAVYNGPLSAIN